MKLLVRLRVRKRDRDGVSQLPPQMTREFHPLSQIQTSAVTTKTGCQGDPLCLSIKDVRARNTLTSRASNAPRVGTLASE